MSSISMDITYLSNFHLTAFLTLLLLGYVSHKIHTIGISD